MGSDFDTIGPVTKERKTLHKCHNKRENNSLFAQYPLRLAGKIGRNNQR